MSKAIILLSFCAGIGCYGATFTFTFIFSDFFYGLFDTAVLMYSCSNSATFSNHLLTALSLWFVGRFGAEM
jgi:hypothetical protein